MQSIDFSLFADYPWVGVALAALVVIVIAAVVHRIGSVVLFPTGIAGTLRDGALLLKRKLGALKPKVEAPAGATVSSQQVASPGEGS